MVGAAYTTLIFPCHSCGDHRYLLFVIFIFFFMNVPDYILGPLDADEEFEHEVSASLAPTPIEEDTERDRRGPKDFRG